MPIQARAKRTSGGVYVYDSPNTGMKGNVKLDQERVAEVGEEQALGEEIERDIKRQNLDIAIQEIEDGAPYL